MWEFSSVLISKSTTHSGTDMATYTDAIASNDYLLNIYYNWKKGMNIYYKNGFEAKSLGNPF